jgi:hypothetical protein
VEHHKAGWQILHHHQGEPRSSQHVVEDKQLCYCPTKFASVASLGLAHCSCDAQHAAHDAPQQTLQVAQAALQV